MNVDEQTETSEVAETSKDGDESPINDWENPPKVSDLKADLVEAKPIHSDHVIRINQWLDNLNITGKAKVNTPKGNSSIVPKLIRKQAEWRYSSLSEPFLSTRDVFKVEPISFEDRDAAKQNQLLLNNQFNTKLDKQRFIDEYVRTAVDEGTVIVRTGWKFEEEVVEQDFPLVQFRANPSLAPMHQQLEQMKQQSPSQYDTDVPEELKQAHDMTMQQGVPIEPVIVGKETRKVTKTVCNHPTAEIRETRNVVIDPTCNGDISKAGFIIDSFETSMSELKKEGKKYKNLKQILVPNSAILSEPDHVTTEGSRNFNFKDEPRKRFVVYEYWGYWDIHGTGTVKPIVAAWVGETMIRLEESPFPDKELPYIVEHYLPVRKSTHGEPDGALLEDNQKVIGAVTRGMIDVMGKSANGQTGIRKDMLDTTNRRKYDNGQDYEFNPNVDPRQGVYAHVYPEIPQSAQFMLQMQNMEAESLTGVKSYASDGISSASLGDVAAGIRGALDAASKRELGILRRLSNGLVGIGRKWIGMNAEFLSEEEVVRVTNEQFVTVRKDDLPGNFDLSLGITTAEEDNAKAQELAFMLQTMGNNMDPEMSRMLLSDIARLRKMPDLAKKIEMYQPQPDPVAQQKIQLEMELLQAQIAAENAKAASYGAKSQLDTAKVGTEAAKAGNIKSDTDQKNLDFVEQESGVKQQRDLQRAGEQAHSNMQLKMMERNFQVQDQNQSQKHDLVKEFVKAKLAKAA